LVNCYIKCFGITAERVKFGGFSIKPLNEFNLKASYMYATSIDA